MIRPVCVKPSINKPVAFAGQASVIKKIYERGPETTTIEDSELLREILNLSPKDVVSGERVSDDAVKINLDHLPEGSSLGEHNDRVSVYALEDSGIFLEGHPRMTSTPGTVTTTTPKWLITTDNSTSELGVTINNACKNVRWLYRKKTSWLKQAREYLKTLL